MTTHELWKRLQDDPTAEIFDPDYTNGNNPVGTAIQQDDIVHYARNHNIDLSDIPHCQQCGEMLLFHEAVRAASMDETYCSWCLEH